MWHAGFTSKAPSSPPRNELRGILGGWTYLFFHTSFAFISSALRITFRGYTSWRPKGANLDEAKRSRVAAVRCSARRLSIPFPKVHGCTFEIVLLTIQSALPKRSGSASSAVTGC